MLVLEDGKIVLKTDKVRIYTHTERILDNARTSYAQVGDDIARLEGEVRTLEAHPIENAPAYDNHLAQLRETLKARRQQQMQLYDEIEALKAKQSTLADELLAEPEVAVAQKPDVQVVVENKPNAGVEGVTEYVPIGEAAINVAKN